MTFQIVPVVIPISFAAALSGMLAVFAWRRRESPMAPAFLAMMAGETAWALGAALEPVVRELEIKRLLIDFRLLGTLVALLGLLAFVLRHTGKHEWLGIRRFGPIAIVGFLILGVAWTDRWHHLYWSRLELKDLGGLRIAIRSYGPGFWAFSAYGYVLVGASTILLGQAVVRSSGLYRAQAALMLLGVLLPWAVEIADRMLLFGFIPADLVSMSFAITGLTFLPALFRLRLLDLTPVAWAQVVRGMDDPVFVLDKAGRIAELNPAARRLIGGPGEILGAAAAVAFERWPALATRLSCDAASEQRFELEGPEVPSKVLFDVHISRLGDTVHPLGRVLVLRDVTHLRSAGEERIRMLEERAARVEAESANRAKDRFLATLSHELRTPLTPVLATATAMLDDPSTPTSIRHVLEMIRRNVGTEARLIDDLLDLTRISRGKLLLKRELIDAHEQILRVIEICGEDAESAGLVMISGLAAEDHQLDADPARFQQVIWNLLKNAIKFSPPESTVTIRTRNTGDWRSLMDRRLVIEVMDQGIGIDAAVLPRIFLMFEQGGQSTERRFGGLGIGLAISKSIVESHGGQIRAVSQGHGKGATLTVELPVSAKAASRPVEPAPSFIPGRASAHRILLVEDNKDTLEYLAATLVRRGHSVRKAANFAIAIREASASEVDLLISDIDLPDGSGLDLMRRLRGTSPVKGIALSGFGSTDDVDQSLSAGFSEHLIKPVEFRRLEQAIEQVMRAPAAKS